jgi:hypothetical protein
MAKGAPDVANHVSSFRSIVAPRLSELETNMYLYLRIGVGRGLNKMEGTRIVDEHVFVPKSRGGKGSQ